MLLATSLVWSELPPSATTTSRMTSPFLTRSSLIQLRCGMCEISMFWFVTQMLSIPTCLSLERCSFLHSAWTLKKVFNNHFGNHILANDKIHVCHNFLHGHSYKSWDDYTYLKSWIVHFQFSKFRRLCICVKNRLLNCEQLRVHRNLSKPECPEFSWSY
jgi:hypothetical protein